MNSGRRVQSFNKGANRSSYRGGPAANYRDAIDIEDAAHAMNSINSRAKREKYEARKAERNKVTLPGGDGLAAWLRKDVP